MTFRLNYLRIHDKDSYPSKSLTSVQHPLYKILTAGSNASHGESRPFKRIETASILVRISLETAENKIHGAQANPASDLYYLASFVHKGYIEKIKILAHINGLDYEHLYKKDFVI